MPKVTRFTHSVKRVAVAALFATALAGHAEAALLNFTASLDGAQANAGAGTGSLATGFATVQLDTVSGDVSVDLLVQGIGLADLQPAGPNGTPVHIHNAPAGSNGGIVWDLGFYAPFMVDGTGIRSTANDIMYSMTQGLLTSPLSLAQFEQELRAGNTYLNIHTATFPGGEIRGQIQLPVATTTWLMLAGVLGLVSATRRGRSR